LLTHFVTDLKQWTNDCQPRGANKDLGRDLETVVRKPGSKCIMSPWDSYASLLTAPRTENLRG